MTPRRTLLSFLVALLAMAAFVAAGCGSDGDDSSSTSGADTGSETASSETSKPDPSKSVLKIGMIANEDNPVNESPEARGAGEAAIMGLNERGGLNGHEVEFVFCTGKAEPNLDAKCAREMVEEGVVAIIGGAAFGDYLTAGIFGKADIPMIGPLAYSPQAAEAPNVFQLGESVTSQQITNMLIAHGGNGIAAVRLDVPTSAEWQKAINERVEEAGGSNTSETAVPGTESDWTRVASVAKAGDPASVFMNLVSQQSDPLMQALEQQGFSGTYQTQQVTGETLKLPPSVLENIIAYDAFPDFNDPNPMSERIVSELAKAEEEGVANTSLAIATPQMTNNAFYAVDALEQVAAEIKGEITAKALLEGFENAKEIDFDGAIPPWTPSDPGPPGPWTERVGDRSRLVFSIDAEGNRVPIVDGFVELDELLEGKYPPLTEKGEELIGDGYEATE